MPSVCIGGPSGPLITWRGPLGRRLEAGEPGTSAAGRGRPRTISFRFPSSFPRSPATSRAGSLAAGRPRPPSVPVRWSDAPLLEARPAAPAARRGGARPGAVPGSWRLREPSLGSWARVSPRLIRSRGSIRRETGLAISAEAAGLPRPSRAGAYA